MKVVLLIVIMCLMPLIALAQETPKVEGSFGYTYERNEGDSDLNGFVGSAGYNAFRKGAYALGLEVELSTVFQDGSLFRYQAGPVLQYGNKHRVYAHTLFGGARVSSGGFTLNDWGATFGGGVKIGFADHLYGKIGVDYRPTWFAGSRQDGVGVSFALGFGK